MKLRSVAALASLSLAACLEAGDNTPAVNAMADSARADSLRADSLRADSLHADSIRADSLRSERETLRQRFTLSRDEIRGKGEYTPRAMPAVPKRGDAYLTCAVDATTGTAVIWSYYRGEGAIFHNRIVARVGARVFETARILPPPAGRPSVLPDGSVVEIVRFEDRKEDGGLMRAIADAGSGTVHARVEGELGSHDFIVSERSRRALWDCARLSDVIRLDHKSLPSARPPERDAERGRG